MLVGDLLQQVQLFSGLSAADIDELGGLAERRDFAPHALILTQGTQGNEIYLVEAGSVEVFVKGYQNEQSLVVLGTGQVFGELALLESGGFRSASVRASAEGATCYVLTADDVQAVCADKTEIGYTVMRNLASELAFKLRHGNLTIA